MDEQLRLVREERRKRHLRETWLPTFFEKYKPLFNPANIAARQIQRFFRKYVTPPVVNNYDLMNIPGLFVYRVQLNDDNLTNPFEKQQNLDEQLEDIRKKQHAVHTGDLSIEDELLEKVIQESLKEVPQKNVMDELDYALQISLQNCDDEYLINKAIIESLETVPKPTFCFAVDLRLIGQLPTTPLEYDGKEYYLNNKQRHEVFKRFKKVSDLKYQQDIELQKSLAKYSGAFKLIYLLLSLFLIFLVAQMCTKNSPHTT